MAKQFITAREVEAYVANGVTELPVNNDVVVTDIGRERAREMGLRIYRSADAPPLSPPPRIETEPSNASVKVETGSVHNEVKKAVISGLRAEGLKPPDNLDTLILRIINS